MVIFHTSKLQIFVKYKFWHSYWLLLYVVNHKNIETMKKITLLIAFIGMISLQSCTVNEDPAPIVDNDTIAEVWEYNQNVNFNASNGYSLLLPFPHAIHSSDMILVYRLSGVSNGDDVWKIQPETYYFNDGTLDFGYDFDFTKYDVSIFMHGFDLANVTAQFRTNQVFRVVVVPGYFGKNAANKIDFSNYNAVIKAFKIDESKIK